MEVVTMDIDDEGRIWLGGTSEFGYMRVIPASERSEKRNAHDRTGHEGKLRSPGELEYVSLTHRISDSLRDFNIVWEVHALSDRVFFNAHETLFVLEKDSIRSLSPKEKFLASHEVNGRIWVPDKGKGLYRTRRDDEDSAQGSTRMEKLPGSDPLGNSGIMMVLGRASGMIRKEKKEVLILTHDQGLYRYRYGKSSENGGERIARVDERKDSLLQKAGIYHATALDPEQNPWGQHWSSVRSEKGPSFWTQQGFRSMFWTRKEG